MHAVEFKAGPRFGVFVLKTGPNYKFKTGPIFFTVFPFLVFWGYVLKTQIVSICAKIVFSQNWSGCQNLRISKKLHFFVFMSFLCC